MNKKNKIQRTIHVDPAIYNLIKSYMASTGNNESPAIEQLIVKGFENVATAEKISDKQHNDYMKLVTRQKEFEDRIAKLIITNIKLSGAAKTFSKVISVNGKYISESVADIYEKEGMKEAIQFIKYKEEE